MILHYKNGHFFTQCSFFEREIPRLAGFQWHAKHKVWHTQNMFLALKLIKYADDEAKAVLTLTKDIDDSKALSSNLEVPCPEGRAFREYQKAGIAWCVKRKTALIADEMGTGKTAQTIGVINYLGLKRVIIVCPATLKWNWFKEIKEWSTEKHHITIISGGKAKIPETGIVIINYDILMRVDIFMQLLHMEFELGVFDEAHYMKNIDAKRTKAALGHKGLAERCDRTILLTGTPVINRPIEFYPILSKLSPETIAPYTNYWEYAKYFCGAYQTSYGWDVTGSSHQEELSNRLRGTLMIRRLKKDVLKELPDKQYQIIALEANKNTGALVKKEQELIATINSQKFDTINFAEYFDDAEAGSILGEIAKWRHEMAIAKLPDSVSHIEGILLDVDKLVIFAHHKAVIDALKEALSKYNVVTLTGSSSEKQKRDAVEKFQNDPKVRIFIGNIKAAGVGITLTAASHVVFVESSWVPGEIHQAVDRLHRLGQKNSVLAQFIVVKGGLDEHILSKALAKQEVIDNILDR